MDSNITQELRKEAGENIQKLQGKLVEVEYKQWILKLAGVLGLTPFLFPNVLWEVYWQVVKTTFFCFIWDKELPAVPLLCSAVLEHCYNTGSQKIIELSRLSVFIFYSALHAFPFYSQIKEWNHRTKWCSSKWKETPNSDVYGSSLKMSLPRVILVIYPQSCLHNCA